MCKLDQCFQYLTTRWNGPDAGACALTEVKTNTSNASMKHCSNDDEEFQVTSSKDYLNGDHHLPLTKY